MGKNIKENIKEYIIYFLGLVILVLGIKTCNIPKEKRVIINTKDTVVKVNTVELVKYDTVTKWKIKYYTLPSDGTIINEYFDTLKNDTVTVYLKAKAVELKETKLGYKANIPTKIIRKDSIVTITNNTTIHDTIIKKTIGYTLNGGLHSQISPINFDFGPVLSYHTPIGNIGYSYGLLNRSHQVFVTIPLIKPKN
jgi:hypothetical protein